MKPFPLCALAAILFGVCACETFDKRGNTPQVTVVPSPLRTSAYDPTVNTSPNDRRPTAPSVTDVSPQQMNAGGNTGILVPVPAPSPAIR